MKKITFTTLSFLLLLLTFSCKTTKYTPTDFPDAQITFGSGGGFTGATTDFTLLENGQLFKMSSLNKEYEALPKVKKEMTQQMFNNYEFLNIGHETINDPGNLYYYIRYKDKDAKEHRITWNDQSEVSSNVKTYYGILMSLVK